jgi:hypothetical protein
LDQRLEKRFVDLPQSADAYTGAKRVEDASVGCAMAITQPGEIPPRALLGQQPGQEVERMHRRQEWQQVRAPELRWAELPARTADRPQVAEVVDGVVGNVWIKQVEQLVGAGHGKAVHGAGTYPF